MTYLLSYVMGCIALVRCVVLVLRCDSAGWCDIRMQASVKISENKLGYALC